METLFAIAVVVLAACGLAIGLVLTGRPPETSCGGLFCINGVRCEGCPKRAQRDEVADNG